MHCLEGSEAAHPLESGIVQAGQRVLIDLVDLPHACPPLLGSRVGRVHCPTTRMPGIVHTLACRAHQLGYHPEPCPAAKGTQCAHGTCTAKRLCRFDVTPDADVQCHSVVALYAIAVAISLVWLRKRNCQPVKHAHLLSLGPPAHLPGCGERRAMAVVASKAQIHGRRAAAHRAGVLKHCMRFGHRPGVI